MFFIIRDQVSDLEIMSISQDFDCYQWVAVITVR